MATDLGALTQQPDVDVQQLLDSIGEDEAKAILARMIPILNEQVSRLGPRASLGAGAGGLEALGLEGGRFRSFVDAPAIQRAVNPQPFGSTGGPFVQVLPNPETNDIANTAIAGLGLASNLANTRRRPGGPTLGAEAFTKVREILDRLGGA